MDEHPRWPRTLVALACLLPLLGFWATGLFDLDEGFYAAVTGEMLRRGEWITPYYNGAPWFEKPILLYWLAMPSVAAFGEAVGPRLPSVICTLAVAFTLYRFVARRFSEAAGLASAAVYGTSLLAVGVGRMMLTDSALVLSLTVAMLALFESFDDPRPGPKRIVAGLALGVSVLAKGPVGLIFFLGTLALTLILDRPARSKASGGWLPAAGAFAAVVSAWYVPAYLANGDAFVQKFLIEQNVGRFAGGDAAHAVPGAFGWIYYLPVLLVGMAPWSMWVPGAWWRAWRGTDPLLKFCAIWALVVFGLFTVSGSKLPHYILSALPPLAILVGTRLAAAWSARRIVSWAVGIGVLVSVLANLAFGVWYYGYHGTVAGRAVSVPGLHAEVHRLASWVRAQGGEVAVYQMSRREKDLGTGGTRLMETSHPSLLFYLDRNVLDTDDLEALISHPGPLWIITRVGRIREEDRKQIEAAGRGLGEMNPFPTRYYKAYWLR